MTPLRVSAAFGWFAATLHAAYLLGARPAPAAATLVGLGALVVAVRTRLRRRALLSAAPPSAIALAAASAAAPTAAPRGRALPAALVAAALLAGPAAETASTAPVAHDAVQIWMPKAAVAAAGLPPRVDDDVRDGAHPEYPRGLAVLAAAVPGAADPAWRGVRLWPLLCAFLTLTLVGAVVAEAAGALAGVAATALVGLPASFAALAASGYADPAVALGLLTAAAGLRRDDAGRRSPWCAAGGAALAFVAKDEGLLVAATTALVLFGDAVRNRRGAALAAALALGALALPWLRLRVGATDRAGLLLAALPENLGAGILRAESFVAEIAHVAFGFPDPSPASPDFAERPPGADPAWCVFVAAAAIAGALRPGPRAPDLRPAACALGAAAFALALTPEPLDWHVATAAPRLMQQALPTLVAAACVALFAPRRGAAPGILTP